MKTRSLDIRRLRLIAICTVCTRALVKEVQQMADLFSELGPSGRQGPAAAGAV